LWINKLADRKGNNIGGRKMPEFLQQKDLFLPPILLSRKFLSANILPMTVFSFNLFFFNLFFFNLFFFNLFFFNLFFFNLTIENLSSGAGDELQIIKINYFNNLFPVHGLS
jgi:hypothetical protein